MQIIKILLSSCSILGASFSSEPFKLTHVQSKPISLFCSVSPEKASSFDCEITEQSPKDQSTKKRIKNFTFSIVDQSGLILGDKDSKELLQIKSSKVVYHERLLNDNASLEKVCTGLVTEKK